MPTGRIANRAKKLWTSIRQSPTPDGNNLTCCICASHQRFLLFMPYKNLCNISSLALTTRAVAVVSSYIMYTSILFVLRAAAALLFCAVFVFGIVWDWSASAWGCQASSMTDRQTESQSDRLPDMGTYIHVLCHLLAFSYGLVMTGNNRRTKCAQKEP